MGQDECSQAFSQCCKVEIPCEDVAGFRITGSFGSVIVRFANDLFAQDDKS